MRSHPARSDYDFDVISGPATLVRPGQAAAEPPRGGGPAPSPHPAEPVAVPAAAEPR